jgi:predicted Zn-dependent peptidase
VLDQVLLQGDDSKLYQALVKKHGMTGVVNGGINLLGNMFNYNGPMLWMASLFHDQNVATDSIMAVVDQVIEEARTNPIEQATLDRALVKFRSNFYDDLGGFFGFGRADLLASFALFDDNPARINQLEDEFRKLTPALLLQTAKDYLRPTSRTILIVEPKAAS